MDNIAPATKNYRFYFSPGVYAVLGTLLAVIAYCIFA